MSGCGQAGLISLDEALERFLEQAERSPVAGTEQLALDQAAGRVLAAPVIAGLDVPHWPNSAMDGYALRLSDWQGQSLPVSQQIFAGSAPEPLQPGSCARIFTGAPLPEGADTVEMQENVRLDPQGAVLFGQPLKLGQHVRRKGEETRVGEQVLAGGTLLRPVELAVAASLGMTTLTVCRRLRVALLSTGDELVEPGQALLPGQIYNSNRVLLGSWLRRLGCEVVDTGILPDDLERTREALGALRGVDLILSSGGVSVGEADFLGQVLHEQDGLTLWKLAIKPGKPLMFGAFDGVPVIGLPGNPVSSLVTFALLARPYLLRRMGVQRVEPLGFEVAAGFALKKAGKRREFLRVRLQQGRLLPYANQGSAILRGAAWADGLAEIREHCTVAEGDPLRFIPYSELFGG